MKKIYFIFYKGFVTCLTSINYIGYTNITFGVSGALFSILFGTIQKYTTQFAQVLFVFTLAIGQAVFIMSWTPEESSGQYVIFLIIFVFSIIEAIGTAQIRGDYDSINCIKVYLI